MYHQVKVQRTSVQWDRDSSQINHWAYIYNYGVNTPQKNNLFQTINGYNSVNQKDIQSKFCEVAAETDQQSPQDQAMSAFKTWPINIGVNCVAINKMFH